MAALSTTLLTVTVSAMCCGSLESIVFIMFVMVYTISVFVSCHWLRSVDSVVVSMGIVLSVVIMELVMVCSSRWSCDRMTSCPQSV